MFLNRLYRLFLTIKLGENIMKWKDDSAGIYDTIIGYSLQLNKYWELDKPITWQ